MKKAVFRLFLIVFILSFAPRLVFAENYNPSINKIVATPSATDEASLQTDGTNVNSFELFWPLAAGKTRADSFYFLKTWKENIRGLFIFGSVQKAEYQTFLATKRVLETESLISQSKYDLASQTEASANNLLNKSENTFKNSTDMQDEVKVTVKNRLDNLIKLIDQLNTKTKEQSSLNEQIVLTHTLIEKNLSAITSK